MEVTSVSYSPLKICLFTTYTVVISNVKIPKMHGEESNTMKPLCTNSCVCVCVRDVC